MIYCSTNNTNGRLGNQIMRVMSLMGLSKKLNTSWGVPEWGYSKYFKNKINEVPQPKNLKQVKEFYYHYTPELYSNNLDLWGYFQSPKYWEEKLEFKDEYVNEIKLKYGEFKNPICVSVRRGDFVNNPNYYQLPITYYILALVNHFPDYKERDVLFFSDDMDYCKVHFECLPNVHFIEGDAIEQLCMMTLCNDFVLSNSTFSYCGAYLSNSENKKVIRPIKNMSGLLALKSDEKDYWVEDWIPFNHEGKKIDLSDVTFTIPTSFDSIDRKQNLDISVCMLQHDFNTNIIVMEHGGNKFEYFSQWCRYEMFDSKVFHRTKMLNQMALMSNTEIIVNFDCDVIVPPMQMLLAVERIRNGQDIVYPYDGRFARVPRKDWFKQIEKSLDAGIFGSTKFKGTIEHPDKDLRDLIGDVEFKQKYHKLLSVGGAVMFNKSSFIEGGMENEYMISYAPEDLERYQRFFKLGYIGSRVKGRLFHIDHHRGLNSTTHHADFKKNEDLYNAQCAMSKEELEDYINTWEWVNQYTQKYYEEIAPIGIESAKEVYAILENHISFDTIVDVGCGIGEWKYKDYEGIDYRVNKKNLLIPIEKFTSLNLKTAKDFIPSKKYDLAICLEVAEHLQEEYANDLIGMLCKLSDCVLFSGAIINQGGVNHHNEQMQSYWASAFKKFGYYPYKVDLRKEMYDNPKIAVWYKNNIILYTKKKYDLDYNLDFIHPELYLNLVKHHNLCNK